MSKRLGSVISGLPSFNKKYAEPLADAAAKPGAAGVARASKQFEWDASTIKSGLGYVDDLDVIDIIKKLPKETQTGLLKQLREVGGLQEGLLKQLRGIDGLTDDVASAAAKSGDELADVGELAARSKKLVGDDATKVNRHFSDMSETALDVEADTFAKNWKTGGEKAFKNLPPKSQEILLKGNQSLRYQAKRSTGLKDQLAGACKSAPVFCDIGKGLGGLGAAVGVGYALEAVYDKVMDELDNDDDVAGCVATCYPDDWYESTVSGAGNKDYKDLTGFKTIEGLRESTGNNNITNGNTPLCHMNQTGEQCSTTCRSRCENLNKTFFQKLIPALTDPLLDIPEKGAESAGNVFKTFLKSVGLDIPMFIGIIITIMIIMVLVSTI